MHSSIQQWIARHDMFILKFLLHLSRRLKCHYCDHALSVIRPSVVNFSPFDFSERNLRWSKFLTSRTMFLFLGWIGWVKLSLLVFYVTCNDISVIYVTVQMCRRTEDEVVPTVGLPTPLAFAGFFNVPVIHRHGTTLLYGDSDTPPP